MELWQYLKNLLLPGLSEPNNYWTQQLTGPIPQNHSPWVFCTISTYNPSSDHSLKAFPAIFPQNHSQESLSRIIKIISENFVSLKAVGEENEKQKWKGKVGKYQTWLFKQIDKRDRSFFKQCSYSEWRWFYIVRSFVFFNRMWFRFSHLKYFCSLTKHVYVIMSFLPIYILAFSKLSEVF